MVERDRSQRFPSSSRTKTMVQERRARSQRYSREAREDGRADGRSKRWGRRGARSAIQTWRMPNRSASIRVRSSGSPSSATPLASNGDLEIRARRSPASKAISRRTATKCSTAAARSDTEEFVSPEHAIRAVAKEMDIDEDVVKEAAQGIRLVAEGLHDEIASFDQRLGQRLGQEGQKLAPSMTATTSFKAPTATGPSSAVWAAVAASRSA